MGIHKHAARLCLWLSLLCAWHCAQAALPPPACPLDFSGLDFASAAAACAELRYGSCCDHSKALVAVAMSQYARQSGALSLPPALLQPCMRAIRTALRERDVRLPVATWCALNVSAAADALCKDFRNVAAFRAPLGFKPVESACGTTLNLTAAAPCAACLDAQAKFLGDLVKTDGTADRWRACADATFLSVASLGGADYAMERANCFFQLRTPDAALRPQSRCPAMLSPVQVTAITESCSDVSSASRYGCCASALLALRTSLAQIPPTSTTFVVSETQGAACIHDLDAALLAHSTRAAANSHAHFRTCNISADEIFSTATHGCHGITTRGELLALLRRQNVDYPRIQASCHGSGGSGSANSCELCRGAVVDATYVVASARGPALDPKALQSCSDLVFLAVASNSTAAEAVELGACLYALPAVVDALLPPELLAPAPVPGPEPHANLALASSRAVARSFTRLTIVLAISVVVTGLAVTLLVLLVVMVYRKRKVLRPPAAEEKPLTGGGKKKGAPLPAWSKDAAQDARAQIRSWRKDCSPLFRHFKFLEIRQATDDFSTIIGRGGFGTVYKARFKDGLVAAVKRMSKGAQQGEQEFCKEMQLLGRLHHRHLVTLQGFCAERHERFLVYEYCENGSLKEQLHAQVKSALTWRTRIRIAMGVAAGLEYLHSYCDPPLCHRDIKSSNILLDADFVAKVADFGLAHAAQNGAATFEPVTTEVRGTPGYMDPEYMKTQELTEKSDVYSFGVLLLELVTARRAVSDSTKLVDWAQKYLDNDSKVVFLVDPDLEHAYSLDELMSVISIIKMCTQAQGKARPTMRQVVRLLYDRFHPETRGRNIASLSVSFSRVSPPSSNHSTPPSKQAPPPTPADLSNFSSEAGSIKSLHSPSLPPSPETWPRQSFNFTTTSPTSPSVHSDQS